MKKEHYLLLGGDEPISWVSVDRDHLLESFHKALQCTCVESVSIGMHMLLLVDESGRLKHRDFNAVASRLYPGSFFNSPICGPAIVAFSGFVDGEPDWVPLPSFMLTALEDAIGLPIPPCPEDDNDECMAQIRALGDSATLEDVRKIVLSFRPNDQIIQQAVHEGLWCCALPFQFYDQNGCPPEDPPSICPGCDFCFFWKGALE